MRRTLSLFLCLILCVGSAAAGMERLVTSGSDWTELSPDKVTDLFASAKSGTAEPFLFVLYSRDCEYSQQIVPQFYDYAEKNHMPIYAMDIIVDSDMGGVSYNFGFQVSGGFPIVLRYSGHGKSVETHAAVRTMEAFEGLVTQKVAPAGDFLIVDGTLTSYLGSSVDVTVPAGVTTIAHHCFAGNTTLRSVTLPEGLTTIEQYAFENCTSLASVNLPSTLQTFGSYAFKNCSALTGPLTLPAGVTALPFGLFMGCAALEAVTLPDSLHTVGEAAFFDCKSLAQLTFGSGLQTLGNTALYNCSHLTKLTFPPSLKQLGDQSLSGCSNLQTISFQGSKPTMRVSEVYAPFSVTTTAAIVYPKDDLSWGTPEALKADFPSPNWGGQPGYRLPVPARSDVDDGTLANWAADEVLHATALELTPTGFFRAFDKPITRIDFCEMLMNLVIKCTAASVFTLSDSAPRDTFSDTTSVNARAAYALGLVSGKGNGLFDPGGSITREEAATMLARTAQYLKAEQGAQPLSFSDRKNCSGWALESIDFVSTLKSPVSGKAVMGSTSGGTFSPKATYSRQEAACSFLRLYQLIANT